MNTLNRAYRILVVEDEPVIAADIQHILSQAGFVVVGLAATASDAYAEFLEHQPDLVMADLQLADGSSGLDAIRKMLAIRSIPTIFVTAFPERLLTEDRTEPTFLITKPFQPETLVAAVTRALTGKMPELPSPASKLRIAAATAHDALAKLQPQRPTDGEVVQYGHNGPPSEAGLPYEEFNATMEVLRRLQAAPSIPPADKSQLEADKERLRQSEAEIARWTASKMAEGFFTKVGENLADVRLWFGLWLVASGHLGKVLDALTAYLNSGWP
jgi:CheY-like chemotaxis protein